MWTNVSSFDNNCPGKVVKMIIVEASPTIAAVIAKEVFDLDINREGYDDGYNGTHISSTKTSENMKTLFDCNVLKQDYVFELPVMTVNSMIVETTYCCIKETIEHMVVIIPKNFVKDIIDKYIESDLNEPETIVKQMFKFKAHNKIVIS